MTTQGILVLNAIGLILLVWMLNLIRRDRLYVGYGVALVALTVAAIAVSSIPTLLNGVRRAVGAVFPASALTLLALVFIMLTLVYLLTQLTILSNRMAALVQELAIQKARENLERSRRIEKALNIPTRTARPKPSEAPAAIAKSW